MLVKGHRKLDRQALHMARLAKVSIAMFSVNQVKRRTHYAHIL